MRDNGKKMYNFLYKMLRNKEDAEDIFQDVFTSFYKRIDRIKKESYQAYLYRMAYNKSLNHIKKNKKKYKLYEDNFTKIELKLRDEKEISDQDEKKKLVRYCLENLSPKYKAVIDFKYFQKKSYKEIAEIMNTSASAVDSLLVRARTKLQKLLKENNLMSETGGYYEMQNF